jgi:hypothetical protein
MAFLLPLLKRYGPYLLLVGAAVGWYHSQIAAAKHQALLQHAVDSVTVVARTGDSLAAVRDRERQARAHEDSVRADSLKHLRAVVVSDAARIRALREAQDTTQLKLLAVDSLVHLIVAERAAADQQAEHLNAVIEQQGLLLHSDSLTIAAQDSTIRDLRASQASTLALLRKVQASANPGILWCSWKAAPVIGAVLVGGYFLGKQ